MEKFDYIVVGSGPSGSMAAQTLVENGKRILMLDVGIKDEYYSRIIPDKSFVEIRKSDVNQAEYFLGKNLEGITWDDSKVGSQLTPPRAHIIKDSAKWLPVISKTFFPVESLAFGGLGGAWGAGCYVFSDTELQRMGLSPETMATAYQVVSDRIGISGNLDDGSRYCLGDLRNIMKAPKMDENSQGIVDSYNKQRKKLNAKGFFLGRSAIALLTSKKENRLGTQYKEMEFWSDAGKSVYKSWMTIDELKKAKNFSYQAQQLVLTYKEDNNGVTVFTRDTNTNRTHEFTADKLIIAAGAIGTARIVLRSNDKFNFKIPVISNPYTYIPCLQWRRMGKDISENKIGLSQLVMYLDEGRSNKDVSMSAIFSYRSLLMFKLIKESPLNYQDTRKIFRYLLPAFTVAGIHHPEAGGQEKFIQLVKQSDTAIGDAIEGSYVLSSEEQLRNDKREKMMCDTLKKLGCYPIKKIKTPHGASIHYAGTLPFSETNETFRLLPSGKLGGTKNIYVADGSGFTYLPSKGLTLTLMANAHQTALNSLLND